jgi:cell division septation protein DedD
MRIKICFLLILLLSSLIIAQEQNITSSLKLIESGDIEEARSNLAKLKSSYPNDASVKFLEAVLTDDGAKANNIYTGIYENYPHSNYADAALYRIFSYYYAAGVYGKAEEIKNLLKEKYPVSPYLNVLNRKIPDTDVDNIDETETPGNIPEKNETRNEGAELIFKYTIQAGAFLNINNAKQLESDFVKAGYTSKIFPKDIGGSIFNVVTVGNFAGIADAEKFLDKLKSGFNISGRIIPAN